MPERAARVGDPPGSRRLQLIEDPGDWAGLRQSWEDLLQRSRHATIFQTWEWIHCWLETFFRDSPGGKLHLLVLKDDRGTLLGAAPLYRESPRASAPLRILADRDVCSDYLDFPVADGAEADFSELLLDHFAAARGAGALLLGAVPDDSFVRQVLLPALVSTAGYWMIELNHDVCPRLALTPDLKGAYNRKYNKLRKSHETAFGHAGTPEETEAGLEDLFRLHQANWTRRGEPGSFATERARAFYRKLAKQLAPRDRMRLYRLRVDGVTVAANMGFALHNEWYGWQAGHDEEWSRRSVGGILQGRILEALAEEGFHRFHFLRGDEAYKSEHWGAAPYHQRDYCVFRTGVRNLCRYYVPHLARRIKGRARARLSSPATEAGEARSDGT